MKRTVLMLMLAGATCIAQNQTPDAQKPMVDDPSLSADYPECARGQRDASLTQGECIARIVLHTVPECKDKTDMEYRKCAATTPKKVPTIPKEVDSPKPATRDPYAGMSEEEKEKATLCSRLKANGGDCDFDKKMAELQRQIDDADKELARINDQIERRRRCVSALRIGMAVKAVLACGSPDHINTDLRGDDQWIYRGAEDGDAVYVYIDRKGKVADVQTSE
jgi:hypothetical protein